MRVQVQKWGNSLALRIPRPFAEDADVRAGTLLDLCVSEGRLVAAPIRRRPASLKQLLTKVTKRNLHGEVDSGPPVGRESW
jgi:antitoxin MazE